MLVHTILGERLGISDDRSKETLSLKDYRNRKFRNHRVEKPAFLIVFCGLMLLANVAFSQDSAQSLVENLSSLSALHDRGVISDVEFNAAKRQLLGLTSGKENAQETSAVTTASDVKFKSDSGQARGRLSASEESLFSNECLQVFERDISFVRERSAIADAYISPILSRGLGALSGGVNADVDRAKRDLLVAERDQKLNAVNSLRDNLINENSSCFNF